MDRLTQLQDALDNQLTLMYASINYIKTRHPYGSIPGQPSQAPLPTPQTPLTTNGDSQAQSQLQPNGPSQPSQPSQEQQDPNQPPEPPTQPPSPPPERSDVFQAALHELARDLVLQEQQIEYLITSLPGLGNSEASQGRRMRELEEELRMVEREREEAEGERERMVEELGGWLGGVRRVG